MPFISLEGSLAMNIAFFEKMFIWRSIPFLSLSLNLSIITFRTSILNQHGQYKVFLIKCFLSFFSLFLPHFFPSFSFLVCSHTDVQIFGHNPYVACSYRKPWFLHWANLEVRPQSSRFIIRNSTYSKGSVSQADVADDLVGERVAVLAVQLTA